MSARYEWDQQRKELWPEGKQDGGASAKKKAEPTAPTPNANEGAPTN